MQKSEVRLNSQELIKDKIDDYRFIRTLALRCLAFLIIALLIPVVLGLLEGIGQLAIGEDVVDTAFEQSPYLKYFFVISMGLIAAQVLVVIIYCFKVDKLNKQLT